MKKLLLGTTALLAAGLLSTQVSAGAVEATNLVVSITGGGTFKIEYKSRQTGWGALETADVSYRNHNAEFTSEIEFKGSTTLDSGTSAGIELELDTSGTVSSDDFIWVEGTFGKFYLGDRDSEELEETIDRTYSGVGLLTVDLTTGASDSLVQNHAAITSSADKAASGTKVTWVAPTVGGVEFAVNYTPHLGEDQTANTKNQDVGGLGEDLLIGLKWTGAMGAATVKVSLGYGVSKAEDPATDKDIEDDKRQRLGFEIAGISGITVGGYYMTHADDAGAVTPTEDETSVGIGGKWESGVWEVGVGWETSKHDEMTDADINVKDGTDKVTRLDIGVNYDLNDDMLIKFGYRQEKYDDDQNLATNENDTTSIDFKFEWNVGDGLEFDIGLQNFRYTHHDGPTAGKKTGTAAYVLTKVSF